MNIKRERLHIVIAGLIIGVIASLLVFFGNPANMGFCIACFLRDIAGACGLHNAAKVQYVRPEIIGLVLGALAMSLATREFRARAGSAPAVRFVLGGFVMIGALAFLGCPLRMVLRLGGGDLDVLVDNQTALENVTRFAGSQGYQVDSAPEGADFRLHLHK